MEIIVLILFLTVVMPRLKDMSMPKKFTDSGAKFYAPSLNANGAAQARRTAAHWQSSFWAGLWAWGVRRCACCLPVWGWIS